MGLFDFLKKNKSDVHSLDTDSSKSEKRTGAFKGDLAFIQDRDVAEKKEKYHTGSSSENRDSLDSEVYISFASVPSRKWSCAECGTCNDENINGCIVCGLRR